MTTNKATRSVGSRVLRVIWWIVYLIHNQTEVPENKLPAIPGAGSFKFTILLGKF